jgi:Fic family protein
LREVDEAQPLPIDPESALTGTPYLIPNDEPSQERFRQVCERSVSIHERALEVAAKVAAEAEQLVEPFQAAIRSELVAESNRIEGYDWSASRVREAAAAYREVLTAPVHALMQAIRADSRIVEALGLYRAQLLAEEWGREQRRPREFEIRALHGIITAGQRFAGEYRSRDIAIGGTAHRPPSPWDVPRAMSELARWWEGGAPDPILDATVVHAWLTHVHPFDDGNGRLARLLANLSLVQGAYPPLLIRASGDRGQYYDALEASDSGDLLPLLDMFSKVVRRTVKTMARPGYVADIVNDRFLLYAEQRHTMWLSVMNSFTNHLRRQLRRRGWELVVQGYPDLTAFALLSSDDPEGNSWYLKVHRPGERPMWLLWFGFTSRVIGDMLGRGPRFPSVFVSVRDEDPAAVHPYRPRFMSEGHVVPSELVFTPGSHDPCLMRWDYDTEAHQLDSGASRLAAAIDASSD